MPNFFLVGFLYIFTDRNQIGVWTINELIAGVGSVDRTAAVKALLTWVDLGVLKEDGDTFRLLEVAEEQSGVRETSRAGAIVVFFYPAHLWGSSRLHPISLNSSGCG